MAEELIGSISDFFSRPVVAGVNLTGTLRVGDKIKIQGHTTSLEFSVDSMQIDNKNVLEARAGEAVGIKVPDRVRKGDAVYKIIL